MAELDYQTALLLQYQFDNEIKENERRDRQLAAELQNQFTAEIEIENPSVSLTYSKKNKPTTTDKSLVDPSWEVIDPTPDIHVLFVAFNDRFFSSKLLAVSVSWSKRMTTCAGICMYQPKGKLCRITLSEPLLKLRPRKDLIETLLHEMIHAFLFVTNNNRDRDGHGPEFHKHMKRINQDAGTNITVYHDFHDEVRLYKQHIWRCDGPCKNWKPYFGMIYRATNRAPGPNDRWWGQHARSCGGNFVKVKGPEKPEKKPKEPKAAKGKEKGKALPDIRGYFNNGNGQKPSNGVQIIDNNKITVTINSNTDSSSNGLSNGAAIPKKSIPTRKTSKKDGEPKLKQKTVDKQPDSSTNSDYESVRNHWLNKFKIPPVEDGPRESKVRKIEIVIKIPIEEPNAAECPICKTNMPRKELNAHLDKCLESQSDKQNCIVCNANIPKTEYERHVIECSDKNYGGAGTSTNSSKSVIDLTDEPEEKPTEKVNCLACGKEVNRVDLNAHLDECLNDVFDERNEVKEEEPGCSIQMCSCPICSQLMAESEMSQHLDDCLTRGMLQDNQ